MNPDVLSDGQKKWRLRGAVVFWRQGDSVALDGKVQSSPLQDLHCCRAEI